MFQGFSQRTVDFMWDIRFNNRKSWFDEHREDYRQDFLNPMKELSTEVFERVNHSCGERGLIQKVSRIYKDARRLRGSEGPYRDRLWFSMEKPCDEWTGTPTFWFELTPDSWSYGMGFYRATPLTMANLRARIDSDPKKFEKFISPLAKQSEFILEGAEYARIKQAPTEKTQEWYNKKSFSLAHYQPNGSEIFEHSLADRLVTGFEFLMPFYDYFVGLESDPKSNT